MAETTNQFHTHSGTDSPQISYKRLDDVYDFKTTYNPGSLIDGAGETKDIATVGAILGDFVIISAPYDLQGVLVAGYVKSAGTTSIRLQNETGGTVDLASGDWLTKIFRK